MKRKSSLWLGSLLVFGCLATYVIAQKFAVPAVPTIPCELRPQPDHRTLVQFRGKVATRYYVQSSDDLQNWSIASGELVGSAGWTKWVDASPSPTGQRFYRVVPAEALPGLAARKAPTTTDRLLAALQAGDHGTALAILTAEGVSETALAALKANLGTPPARAQLNESFLKAGLSLERGGSVTRAVREAKAASLDYQRICWRAEPQWSNWQATAETRLAQVPVPPIAVLNVRPGDTNLIALFKWFDQCAERIHSVVLNGEDGDNRTLKPAQYGTADMTLAGLRQLVKARKPDVFVWLTVEHQDSATDVKWLQSLSFKPDGLLVGNLTQFHSPFATVRDSYRRIMGDDCALVVAGFYGYKDTVRQAGQAFEKADREAVAAERAVADADPKLAPVLVNRQQRLAEKQTALTTAERALGEAGRVVGPLLPRQEEHLRSLGYRGLILNWQALQALAAADRRTE